MLISELFLSAEQKIIRVFISRQSVAIILAPLSIGELRTIFGTVLKTKIKTFCKQAKDVLYCCHPMGKEAVT